jgi:hypothetical protein
VRALAHLLQANDFRLQRDELRQQHRHALLDVARVVPKIDRHYPDRPHRRGT